MTPRQKLLEEASRIVSSDRNVSYGEPKENFERIATIWNAMFGTNFEGHHVALAMIGVKMSRLSHNRQDADGWTDVAGYAATGYETTVIEVVQPVTL